MGIEISTGPMLITAMLILTRVFVIVNIIPFLFGNPVPGMVKLGSTFLLVLILYPHVAPTVPEGIFNDYLFVVALMLKEAFYGLAIGLAGSLIFYGFDAAGQVIDNQRGASMAQIFSPQTGRQVTIFGSFSFQLAVVIFLSLGGHRIFLQSMAVSYAWLPIYEMPVAGVGLFALMDHFIKISGMVLLIAAQLAAPILISIFVVDLILGVMNRISPAINVLTLGFAIRGVMGVGIFFLAFTSIAYQMRLISMESMANVTHTIRFLATGV
jgi:type III secretory pathway component EscT